MFDPPFASHKKVSHDDEEQKFPLLPGRPRNLLFIHPSPFPFERILRWQRPTSSLFRNCTAAHRTAAGRSRRGFGDTDIELDQLKALVEMAVRSGGPTSCLPHRFDLEASEMNQGIDPEIGGHAGGSGRDCRMEAEDS
jgi:hypothetical protein